MQKNKGYVRLHKKIIWEFRCSFW